MSEPSDWEPLPEDQLLLHPGEVPFAPPSPPPPPVPPGTPLKVAPQEHPQAERMLQQLQAQLKQAPAPRSLLAEAERREQKERRKLQAVNSPQLADLHTVQAGRAPGQVQIEFDPGEHGRDDREDEAWFKSLPAAERERLQAVWSQRRVQHLGTQPAMRRSKNQRSMAAIVVATAVMLLGSGTYWHATIGAGICAGIIWRHVPPCRFRYPVIAFACLFVLQLLAWGVTGGDPPRQLFMDGILIVALAAMVGFDGEIRRTGGFVEK